MKKIFKLLIVILFLTSGYVSAQNFTVSIKETDDYANYFSPIKAGGSFQFQIKVQNLSKDTCTVSINKDFLGSVESWVSISNNSKVLFPSQTVEFLLNVSVPSGTADNTYWMYLHFDYKPKKGNSHWFTYDAQKIIVDNTAPTLPTFTVSTVSSKAISVDSWASIDAGSDTYTTWNWDSGVEGIKNYTLEIKDLSGNLVKSETKSALDASKHHVFNNLTPNTKYQVVVTATDLAGNSKSDVKTASTAPAAPTDLKFSNTAYGCTTLSWKLSDGATGYDVYQVVNGVNTKINTKTISGNSFTINNLSPNTGYSFNVIALSNVGPSPNSVNASVTTLPLPIITGSDVLCSGNSKYIISDLITGYTVTWSNSSNLTFNSQTGNTAIFKVSGLAQGWIEAQITAPYGQTFKLDTKDIWIGKPEKPTVAYRYLPEVALGADKYVRLKTHRGALSETGNWSCDQHLEITGYSVNSYDCTFIGKTLGLGRCYVTTYNECGVSEQHQFGLVVIKKPNPNYPVESISPNPTTSIINIKIATEAEESNTLNTLASVTLQNETYNITITNSMGKVVYTGKMTADNKEISVSAWQKGIYYAIITNGVNTYKDSFIVE